MQIPFEKFQGTGNDFVMIDDRLLTFPQNNTDLVARLCDRRFGIGADGLILLQYDTASGLKMEYYNSDGYPGSMCGNGGRCFAAFAKKLGLASDEITFTAADGPHKATFSADGIVSLEMADVTSVEIHPNHVFMNTGSPHHVAFVENLADYEVKEIGEKIRYGQPYGQTGTNVNFVEPNQDGTFSMRTYERGVEDETLSCGTGATAVAIAMHLLKKTAEIPVQLRVQGGNLEVSFEEISGMYKNVKLIGPAEFVYSGTFPC